MPFGDLIERRRSAEHAGRRFNCRPPTLATVYRLLEAYAPEVQLARTAYRVVRDSAPDTAEKACSVLRPLVLNDPKRLRQVLETCVDDEVPDGAEEACLDALLSMTDVLRIGSALARDFDGRSMPSDVDGPTRLAVEAGKVLGRSPVEIANDWPYEALLTITDALTDAAENAGMAAKIQAGGGMPLTAFTPGPGEAVKKRQLIN